MKINHVRLMLISALAYTALSVSVISMSWASEAEDFVAKLNAHYQHAPSLEVFSLDYHYLGQTESYYSRDYQLSDRYLAIRMVEIDLVKEHFFENDIHHFNNGRTFNRVQFQNDEHSLFFDRNGISLGKHVIKQGMETFAELKGHIFSNVDFLAVKPLLEEKDIAATIKFQHNKGADEVMLTHQTSNNNVESVIEYVFQTASLQLVSINNVTERRYYVYGDYQTINGVTFARSIDKYFDGADEPNFIHRIDQLNIIENIDPSRFEVPEGFAAVIPEADGKLVSTKIAADLYLVTDSSARRNVLFKVTGDEIAVFGAPQSEALSDQTIKLIARQFPNKAINSVYVTHPHGDSIAGLAAYAKRNIVIRSDAYSIEAIKAYPDFLADIGQFKFQVIEHNEMIDDVSFYVLESSHSKRHGFVHFKDEGIVYQAELLSVPFDNTVPEVVPNSTKTFVDFVRAKRLKFSRIVGLYSNNNITVDVMNKHYKTHM